MRSPALIAALFGAVLPAKQQQPGGTDRTRTVIEAVHRSGSIQRCWNAYVHQVPDGTSARFRLRVDVAADGRVSNVAVLDPAPAPLTGCIQNQVGRLSLPSGSAVTVETTYAFEAGHTVPVPAAPESAPPAAH